MMIDEFVGCRWPSSTAIDQNIFESIAKLQIIINLRAIVQIFELGKKLQYFIFKILAVKLEIALNTTKPLKKKARKQFVLFVVKK